MKSARQKRQWTAGASKKAFAIIAAQAPGTRRRDAVAVCVAEGINIRTARTQWQRWLDTQKQEPPQP